MTGPLSQHLLDRAPAPAIDMIEHLGGMQAQAPLAPYVGLWSRLQDSVPEELSALTEQRRVVRLHLMRATVHLVSARDCLDWRPLFRRLHRADFRVHFGDGAGAADLTALLSQAQRLLAQRPRTHAELGTLLAERWPDPDPGVLAYAVTHHIPLCQVPPRGTAACPKRPGRHRHGDRVACVSQIQAPQPITDRQRARTRLSPEDTIDRRLGVDGNWARKAERRAQIILT